MSFTAVGEDEPQSPIPESFHVDLNDVMAHCGFPGIKKDGAGVDEASMTVGTCLSMGYPTPQPQFMPFEDSPATQVQHYTRPAAGMTLEDEARRPPRVLDISMKFLTDHILRSPRLDWNTQYFRKFEYLWDRFRQVRQDWSAQTDTSHRRKKWLEYMVRVFALRTMACSRNEADCAKFLDVKKNNSESLKDTFGQLASVYRSENKKRNNELVAAGVLFHGLQLNAKIETYAGWLRSVAARDMRTGEELLDLEHCSRSVDLVQVYKELESIPCAAESTVVQNALLLLHTLSDGEWFRFLSLLWELDLPMLLRCFVGSIITYVRFRAIYDLYMSRRFRGHMTLEDLSRRLMFDRESDCLTFCQRAGFPCTPLTLNEETGETIMALQVTLGPEKKEVYSATELSAKVGALEKAKYKLVFPIHRDFMEWETAARLTPEQEEQQEQDREAKLTLRATSSFHRARTNENEGMISMGSELVMPDGYDDDSDNEGGLHDREATAESVTEPSYDPRSPECPIDYMFYLEIHFPPNLTFTHHQQQVEEEDGSLAAVGFNYSVGAAIQSDDLNLKETGVIRNPMEFDDFAEAEFTDSSSCVSSAVSGLFGIPGAAHGVDSGSHCKWRLPEDALSPQRDIQAHSGTAEHEQPDEDATPLPSFDEYVAELLRQSEEVMQKLNCRDVYQRRVGEKKMIEFRQWEERAAKDIQKSLAPEESRQCAVLLTDAARGFSTIVKLATEEKERIERQMKENIDRANHEADEQRRREQVHAESETKRKEDEMKQKEVATAAFIAAAEKNASTATETFQPKVRETDSDDDDLSIPFSDSDDDVISTAVDGELDHQLKASPPLKQLNQPPVAIDVDADQGDDESTCSSISMNLTDTEDTDAVPPLVSNIIQGSPSLPVQVQNAPPIRGGESQGFQPTPSLEEEPSVADLPSAALPSLPRVQRRRLTRDERRSLICGNKTMDQILQSVAQESHRESSRRQQGKIDGRVFRRNLNSSLGPRSTKPQTRGLLVDVIPSNPQDISPIPQWELPTLQQAAVWYRALPSYRRALLLSAGTQGSDTEVRVLRSQTPTNLLVNHINGNVQLHTVLMVVGDVFTQGAAPVTAPNSTSRSIALMLCDFETQPKLFVDGDERPSGAVQTIKERALTFQLEAASSMQVQSSVEVSVMDHSSVPSLRVSSVDTFCAFFVVVIERNKASLARGLQTLDHITSESKGRVPGSSCTEAGGFVTQGVLVVVEDTDDGDLTKLIRLRLPATVHYVLLPVVDVIAAPVGLGDSTLADMTSTTFLGDVTVGGPRKRAFPGQDGPKDLRNDLRHALKASLEVLMAYSFEQNSLIRDVGSSFVQF